MKTATLSASNKTAALAIDFKLLDNRYAIELNEILSKGLSAYDERSAKIQLDKKHKVVREALVGLYDLGVQHTCNLSELLANFDSI